MISQYMGLVPIPLFSAGNGWNYEGGTDPADLAFIFANNSYGPLHQTTVNITETGTIISSPEDVGIIINAVYGYQPAVGGTPATLILNQGDPTNGLHANWYDDKLWFQANGVNPNNPPSVFKVFTPWINKPMGRNPGDYNSIPPYNFVVDQIGGGGSVSYIGEVMPGMYQGQKVGVCFTIFQTFPPEFPGTQFGWSTWDGANIPINSNVPIPISCSALNLGALKWNNNRLDPMLAFFDNIAFFSNNNNDEGCIRVLYNAANAVHPFIEPIELEDSNLNTYFQDKDLQVMSIYYAGFISAMRVGGAGPTGSPTEFAVFNRDMSQYWVIQFEPQDQFTTDLMASNGSWQLSIDNEGIFWFSTSSVPNNTSLAYSFSPIHFTIPSLYSGNLEPIVLPCFNTCTPVALL